jgi:hypothetical protein
MPDPWWVRIVAKPVADPEQMSDLDFCKCGHQRCLHLEDGCGICKLGDCAQFDNAPTPEPVVLRPVDQRLLEPTAFIQLATRLAEFESASEVVFETDRDGHLLRVQVFGEKSKPCPEK